MNRREPDFTVYEVISYMEIGNQGQACIYATLDHVACHYSYICTYNIASDKAILFEAILSMV